MLDMCWKQRFDNFQRALQQLTLCAGSMNTHEFGLPTATLETIRRIPAEVPAVEKVLIYGPRAKGNNRTGFDIDLPLFGKTLNLDILGQIAARLDESPIPNQVDLSIFEKIDHAGLCEHIERVGQLFYQR